MERKDSHEAEGEPIPDMVLSQVTLERQTTSNSCTPTTILK